MKSWFLTFDSLHSRQRPGAKKYQDIPRSPQHHLDGFDDMDTGQCCKSPSLRSLISSRLQSPIASPSIVCLLIDTWDQPVNQLLIVRRNQP